MDLKWFFIMLSCLALGQSIFGCYKEKQITERYNLCVKDTVAILEDKMMRMER